MISLKITPMDIFTGSTCFQNIAQLAFLLPNTLSSYIFTKGQDSYHDTISHELPAHLAN